MADVPLAAPVMSVEHVQQVVRDGAENISVRPAEALQQLQNLAGSHESLRAALAERTTERDEAQSNFQFMVDKATANGLEHYREMGRETLAQIERAERYQSDLIAVVGEREALIGKVAELQASVQAARRSALEEAIRVAQQQIVLGELGGNFNRGVMAVVLTLQNLRDAAPAVGHARTEE